MTPPAAEAQTPARHSIILMSELSAEVTGYDLSSTGTVVEFEGGAQDSHIGWYLTAGSAADFVVEVRGRQVGWQEIDSYSGVTDIDDGRIMPEIDRVRIRNTSTVSDTADAVLGGA